MKITYDKNVDAAYIYFKYPINNGEVKKTIRLNENINTDYDNMGKMIGIEILNASKILSETVLKQSVAT